MGSCHVRSLTDNSVKPRKPLEDLGRRACPARECLLTYVENSSKVDNKKQLLLPAHICDGRRAVTTIAEPR